MKTFILILAFFSCFAQDRIPITLEHAVTIDQQAWGLMGRKSLPENHGMAFSYRKPKYQSFWMFNVFIDLSLAFLDDQKVIREIHTLKAYPEMMDPNRPVESLHDIDNYSFDEPVIRFFLEREVKSSFPIKYALEMGKDWFSENGVQVGDVVFWSTDSPEGYIIKSSK